MLELKELRFKNFGRFLEEQSIDFASLSSFTQIDGKNNNTGGSSGAAKSTIFMALDYLLGFNQRPATILQCRYTEESLWVQGLFGDNIKITRSKGLIQVEIETNVIKGSKAEEYIDQLIGMPRDLFRKVIHKRQKEGGFFLSFTPAEMHNFLIDCIGLSKHKKDYEILDKELKRAKDELVCYENNLNHDQAALNATQDAILALGMAPIQDMHKEVVLELKEKYGRSTVRFSDVQQRCEAEYQEFNKNRPVLPQSRNDNGVRENLEKRRDEIERAISTCLDEERKRQEKVRSQISKKEIEGTKIVARIKSGDRAKTDVAKLASEIKSIRAQICPTCEQNWASKSAAIAEQKKIEELTKIKIILADAAKAENEKIALESELERLKEELQPVYDPALPDLNDELTYVTSQILDEQRKAGELYEQQTAETKLLLDQYVIKQGELSLKHKLEIEQARGQMDVDRRVFESAVQKLKAYEDAKARYEKTLGELKSKENPLLEKITKTKEKIESLALDEKKASESLKALKTYVSISFDKALDDISQKATQIIRCIPNMSNATIQFEGTKETKRGEVKEEVNAILSMDGEPSVPIKSLSGGEMSSADLAVDLAVIDYIETRSGMGMNIFILDEPFQSLDSQNIEQVLEMIKNSNIRKKIIIVEHNPEVKQMVQSRLVVVRDGLYSRIEP